MLPKDALKQCHERKSSEVVERSLSAEACKEFLREACKQMKFEKEAFVQAVPSKEAVKGSRQRERLEKALKGSN